MMASGVQGRMHFWRLVAGSRKRTFWYMLKM